MESISFRLTNLLKLTNSSLETIWGVVKKIKLESSIRMEYVSCSGDFLYDNSEPGLLERLERKLKVNSSNLRFENITAADLKTAAEMFVYLFMCPGDVEALKWFNAWTNFNNFLYKTQSPAQIIMSLNRLMKRNVKQEMEGNNTGVKQLFIKTLNTLSLQYKTIHSMLPRSIENPSSGTRQKIITTLKTEGVISFQYKYHYFTVFFRFNQH